MVSILVPTRGRFDFVSRMLNSVISNAESVENYEIIFGIDNDDIFTADKITNYLSNSEVNYKIVYFDRLFYKGFHLYIEELFNNCNGEIIWPFADDFEILTKNWDSLVLQNKDEMYLKVKLTCGYNTWNFSIVPIISRKWIEVTGRISNNSQTDLWLGYIAYDLNIVKDIDVLLNLFNPSNGGQHSYFTKEDEEWQKDKEKIKNYLNE